MQSKPGLIQFEHSNCYVRIRRYLTTTSDSGIGYVPQCIVMMKKRCSLLLYYSAGALDLEKCSIEQSRWATGRYMRHRAKFWFASVFYFVELLADVNQTFCPHLNHFVNMH